MIKFVELTQFQDRVSWARVTLLSGKALRFSHQSINSPLKARELWCQKNGMNCKALSKVD